MIPVSGNCGHDYFAAEHTGDPETASFYAKDWKLLRRMIKVRFTPVKPHCYVEDPIRTLPDVYWALYRLWHNNVKYWKQDITLGLRNLRRWGWVIWRTREWDHSYLWEIMLIKMKAMQPELRKHVVDGPHQAALDRCVHLLEEVSRRNNCNCAKIDNYKAGCMAACAKEQKAMLREFGQLFAEFSPAWWD